MFNYAGAAGASVQGSMGIISSVIGYYQRKKAREMEKSLVRPNLNVPDNMQGYMTDMQKQALMGLPEAQRQNYLNQIQRNMSYAVSANADRGGMLQGVAQANMTANDAAANLLGMDAQAVLNNTANYNNAQLNYANFKDSKFAREFEYNQNQPYLNKAAAIRALYGAGMQNGYEGLRTVADSGATFAGGAGSGGGGQQPIYNYGNAKMAEPQQVYTTNPYAGQQQMVGGQNQTPNNYVYFKQTPTAPSVTTYTTGG